MLKNRIASTHLYKVRAHTNIIGNEEADKLTKEGRKIELVSDIPRVVTATDGQTRSSVRPSRPIRLVSVT
jgi:hypothetical protein